MTRAPEGLPLRARIVANAMAIKSFGALPTRWRALNVSPGKAATAVVYETVLRPGGRRVVLKAFAEEDKAHQTFERQVTASRRYPNTLQDIAYSQLGRAIIMPRAAGQPGLAALRNHPFDRVFEGPLRWLGQVHATAPASPRTILSGNWFKYRFQQRVLKEFPWAVPFHRNWHAFAGHLPGHRATTVHGDFQPGNIICDGKTFTIIDFDRPETGSAQRELAQLINRLQVHYVDTGLPTAEWRHYRDDLFRWYGAPDLAEDPVFACAMQYWRILSLRGAAAHPDTAIRNARLAHLHTSLSRPPTDIAAVTA